MMKKLLCLVLLIATTINLVAQSVEKNEITFIKAGKLFDSENAKLLEKYIIKIENNKITEVGKKHKHSQKWEGN